MPRRGILNIEKIDQPREKLIAYGPEKLSTAELLAILLRTGKKGQHVVDMSKSILRQFKAEGLVTATHNDLLTFSGLGPAKACELVACIELGKRLLKDKQSVLLLTPEAVWQEMKDIRASKKEHAVVFFLNTRKQEIERRIISIGTLNASMLHPRELFEPAIKVHAASIILSHNHPSGDPEPSGDDISITRRIVEAGKILGIELLDHVIVTPKKWVSMRETGLLSLSVK
jgi:DNA repair protein RadC